MKTLQNDFTTPEQSKRLLELGVPANSANMWWEKDETIRINGEWVHGAAWSKVPSPFNWDRENNRFYTYSEIKETVEDFTGNETLPCWSVGRLMEIIDICVPRIQSDTAAEEYPSTVTIMDKLGMSYVDYLVGTIGIATKARMLDFSKLEEQE